MAAETREWVVVISGAVTIGETVFEQGQIVNLSQLGDHTDYFFERNSVRWAEESEIPKKKKVEAPSKK